MGKPRRKIQQVTEDLIKVHAARREFLISAACSHRQGKLVYAYVNDRTLRITCPLHHSTFDLVTGCPLSGPANAKLRAQEDRRTSHA